MQYPENRFSAIDEPQSESSFGDFVSFERNIDHLFCPAQTLEELEKAPLPPQACLANSCTRIQSDRRQYQETNKALWGSSIDRRSGRDRRLMTYF